MNYYRRQLPACLVDFASEAGRNLFKECLESGHLENYFRIGGNFTTQAEPSFCGLGSLSMVLNALEVDPGRTWKGVWRWYSDEMLACCVSLQTIKEKGIDFGEFSCLARCNGLQVKDVRHAEGQKEMFEQDLLAVTRSGDKHMVVSFSRKALEQTGGGHFSPIGAYNPRSRMVLVLDVARFKYPSYWVSLDRLWAAMRDVDPTTSKPRGYFVLSRRRDWDSIDLVNWTLPLPFALIDQLYAAEDPAAHYHRHRTVLGRSILTFAKAGIDLCGPGMDSEQSCEVEFLKQSIESTRMYVEIMALIFDGRVNGDGFEDENGVNDISSATRDERIVFVLLLLSTRRQKQRIDSEPLSKILREADSELETCSSTLIQTVKRLSCQYEELLESEKGKDDSRRGGVTDCDGDEQILTNQ